jgi:hypothetical protein
MSALKRQEGGGHYKDLPMQPIVFCHANKLGGIESSVVKRMCRWQEKGGVGDLRKAIHEIEVLIELTEMAEKRAIMEAENTRPYEPDRDNRMPPETIDALKQAFGPKGPKGDPSNPEWPRRECTCTKGVQTAPWCHCPPDEAQGAQKAQAEAAVYDRGNPHHYRLTPGLTLPSDLPDGTVVEGPTNAMGWERIGTMHRGMLVRD